MLPIKTTLDDIDGICDYLRTQVGWVSLDKARKTIDPKVVDGRKLEAYRRLGLVDRDGQNIKLSTRGRAYATASDASVKQAALAEALRDVPLYAETLEWIHHSKVVNPSRSIIGNHWHDNFQGQLEGAQGAALTDAVIFFMRVADGAGLGRFTRGSGAHPDTYLKTNAEAIEAFVDSLIPEQGENDNLEQEQDDAPKELPPGTVPEEVRSEDRKIKAGTSPAVHVNVQIHIAADATPETVAEIFKNMQKYVLNNAPADKDV